MRGGFFGVTSYICGGADRERARCADTVAEQQQQQMSGLDGGGTAKARGERERERER